MSEVPLYSPRGRERREEFPSWFCTRLYTDSHTNHTGNPKKRKAADVPGRCGVSVEEEGRWEGGAGRRRGREIRRPVDGSWCRGCGNGAGGRSAAGQEGSYAALGGAWGVGEVMGISRGEASRGCRGWTRVG
jgi:hypothetical protein